MSGYQFFRTYQSLHWHFTSKFDVLKYGEESKTLSIDNFNKRKDKLKFETFASKIQGKTGFYFCIANFVHNDEQWFYGDFKDADAIYRNWRKYFDAFTYNFKAEIKKLENIVDVHKLDGFKSLMLQTSSGNKPPLLQLLLHSEVTPECVCMYVTGFNFLESWSELYLDDPLVQKKLFIIKKYQPLCKLISKELGSK